VIILLIPAYAARDAWNKLSEKGEPWTFETVARPGTGDGGILPLVDPKFGIAACRFNLETSALLVEADGILPFWSAAIFDRQGRNIYSFNDRTAIGRRLSIIVVDPVQLAQIRKFQPEEVESSVLVEADITEGFILIRAFQEDESWSGDVQAFLDGATCSQFQIQ